MFRCFADYFIKLSQRLFVVESKKLLCIVQLQKFTTAAMLVLTFFDESN